MHRQRHDDGVWPGMSVQKATVQSTVRIESRDSTAGHTIDGGEASSDEHLAIALHSDRIDGRRSICVTATGAGQSVLKADVQRAVGVKSRNIVSAHSLD